jgi:hypothetical protein
MHVECAPAAIDAAAGAFRDERFSELVVPTIGRRSRSQRADKAVRSRTAEAPANTLQKLHTSDRESRIDGSDVRCDASDRSHQL